MGSFLIHRYDDSENLNPFLSVSICEDEEEKVHPVHPVKANRPVVIKLRLLHMDWRHGKQIFVNALVVICLVCIGVIPLVSWPQQRNTLQFAGQALQISNDNAQVAHGKLDLSELRSFQDKNDEVRRRDLDDSWPQRELHDSKEEKLMRVRSIDTRDDAPLKANELSEEAKRDTIIDDNLPEIPLPANDVSDNESPPESAQNAWPANDVPAEPIYVRERVD
ncbi:Aste57867_21657 [Aphanomyces stellatus]|uniref:Aste57867_21657 protein n=1 Tax=Aphanomyces stellatus TaxID=120398 RepID=A0A485LK63_9STRA|nr:hypothetical protein As57867_021588 [Aphanomyces stellatus]VFT98326.1 Aste57867_21657 [Aphanomyces stellatus]